jgi:hypothetical protein
MKKYMSAFALLPLVTATSLITPLTAQATETFLALTRVDGAVASALHDKNLTWTRQIPADPLVHAGLLVDGDYLHSANIVNKKLLIKKFLNAGKFVVFVDLEDIDDRDGVLKVLGISSRSDSFGVIYHRINEYGLSKMAEYNFARRVDLKGNIIKLDNTTPRKKKLLREDATEFVAELVKRMSKPAVPVALAKSPKALSATSASTPVGSLISGNTKITGFVSKGISVNVPLVFITLPMLEFATLSTVSYIYDTGVAFDSSSSTYTINNAPTITTTPTIYTPSIVSTNGIPSTASLNTGVGKCGLPDNGTVQNYAQGYPQTSWQLTWTLTDAAGRIPGGGVGGTLAQIAASPTNTNNMTNVSSQGGVSLDADGLGLNYSVTRSTNIQDWNITLNSNSSLGVNQVQYVWSSGNPIPSSTGSVQTQSSITGLSDFPFVNALNTGELQMIPAFGWSFISSSNPGTLNLSFAMTGQVESWNFIDTPYCQSDMAIGLAYPVSIPNINVHINTSSLTQ